MAYILAGWSAFALLMLFKGTDNVFYLISILVCLIIVSIPFALEDLEDDSLYKATATIEIKEDGIYWNREAVSESGKGIYLNRKDFIINNIHYYNLEIRYEGPAICEIYYQNIQQYQKVLKKIMLFQNYPNKMDLNIYPEEE